MTHSKKYPKKPTAYTINRQFSHWILFLVKVFDSTSTKMKFEIQTNDIRLDREILLGNERPSTTPKNLFLLKRSCNLYIYMGHCTLHTRYTHLRSGISFSTSCVFITHSGGWGHYSEIISHLINRLCL